MNKIKIWARIYIPDVWVKFNDEKQKLFDIKHSTFFDNLKLDADEAKKYEKPKKTLNNHRFCKSRQ